MTLTHGDTRLKLDEVDRLRRAGYRIVGRHSAVKICHWTKSVLRGGKNCYKGWYGVQSHRCLQMTPSLQYCNMMCVFCWRHHTINRIRPYGGEWDRPEEILDELIKEQRQLLSGFKGNPKVDPRLYEEAMEPNNAAISLDGEPTLYPFLRELISILHERGMTTFLVTNGTMPEMLKILVDTGAEPTNLYISLYGPDRRTHVKTCRPLINNSWERLIDSLRVMRTFNKSRRVIRLTLVKGYTMKDPEKYAELIRIADPDFIECKGYVHVGESQKRLPRSAMPSVREVEDFAKRLQAHLRGYEYIAKDVPSRVCLLAKKTSPHYDETVKNAERMGELIQNTS
ncbi:MAG: 4-demethylwyosine synthase TYW1 [Thaumarchaeota archaeon]|nr:4-demethylwyosine synthase TYW1 [Nitrososphaerota archaeon]